MSSAQQNITGLELTVTIAACGLVFTGTMGSLAPLLLESGNPAARCMLTLGCVAVFSGTLIAICRKIARRMHDADGLNRSSRLLLTAAVCLAAGGLINALVEVSHLIGLVSLVRSTSPDRAAASMMNDNAFMSLLKTRVGFVAVLIGAGCLAAAHRVSRMSSARAAVENDHPAHHAPSFQGGLPIIVLTVLGLVMAQLISTGLVYRLARKIYVDPSASGATPIRPSELADLTFTATYSSIAAQLALIGIGFGLLVMSVLLRRSQFPAVAETG